MLSLSLPHPPQVVQREFSGPVTCLREFKGMMLLGVGARVELHQWSSVSRAEGQGEEGVGW